MKKNFKIAIIGFGNIGKKRLDSLIKIKNIDICYIVDKKKNFLKNIVKFKKNNKIIKNIKYLSSYKNLIDKNRRLVDAAIIATPPSKVYTISSYLLKNSINLLVEKPLGVNLNETKKLTSLSLKNKAVLKTGFNLRFDTGINYLKKNLKKVVGKVYYAKIQYSNGAVKTNTNNIGALLDIGNHSLDLISYLFDKNNFTKISNIQSSHEYHKDDNGFILLRSEDNINFFVHYSFITWKNKFELEIGGKKGTAIVSSLPKWGDQKVLFYKRIFPSGTPKVTKKIFKIENSWLDECRFFIKLCKEKKFNCNQEGLESMMMLNNLKNS